MSILIKGMKKPQNCFTCPFKFVEADVFTGCRLPDRCPIVEIPPHGPLVDKDKLDRAFSDLRWQDGDWQTGRLAHWGDRPDWCLQGEEIETLIKNAPTIIEAEEEQ